MSKQKKYQYYDNLSSFHSHALGILEYIYSHISKENGSIKYHTLLLNPFLDLGKYAETQKDSYACTGIMDNFPLNGFRYSRNIMRSDCSTFEKTERDSVFLFSNGISGLSKSVYVGTFYLMESLYGMTTPVPFSFVISDCAYNARKFVEKYNTWKRDVNKNSILNFRGDRMLNFRKMDWDNIFLPGKIKEEIKNDVSVFFKSKKLYESIPIDWRLGILLVGPPGNGKTAICRAIATSTEQTVIYCSLGEDVGSILQDLNDTILSYSPCVVIIEDVDIIGSDPSIRSMFLNMLDGLFSTQGVLTIATTNNPDKLDPAFITRPSRFDSYYILPNPEEKEIKKIFINKLGKTIKLKQDKIDDLVLSMKGFSAAFIQEVVTKSLRDSFRFGKKLSYSILEKSIKKVKEHIKSSEEGIDGYKKGTIGFSASMDNSFIERDYTF